MTGCPDAAKRAITKEKRSRLKEPGVVLDVDVAMQWWALGKNDKSFHFLFQCLEKRMGPVAILIEYPMFNDVTSDPRYQLIKEKLNLLNDGN